MNIPTYFTQVKQGLRYSVNVSTLLAHSREIKFRQSFLYRTPNGRYFILHLTLWENESDHIEPIHDINSAQAYFENAPYQVVTFEIAFPQEDIKDA